MQNGGSTWALAWSVPIARQPGYLRRIERRRYVVSRVSATFQFHGSSVSSSCRLVRPDTMRSSTSVSQANGSTSFSFADWISVAKIAQCLPPLSDPANKAFFRPRATGRKARSMVLVSRNSRRPSSKNRISPLQWFNSYRIARANAGKSPRCVRHGFRLRCQQRVPPCIELAAADAVLARHLCRRCARR